MKGNRGRQVGDGLCLECNGGRAGDVRHIGVAGMKACGGIAKR